jgi:hypothetical protein
MQLYHDDAPMEERDQDWQVKWTKSAARIFGQVACPVE